MEEPRLRVSKNKVLGRIFEPKREKVAGGWRKLHSDELRNFYFSPNVIRVIKSRGMTWAGHVVNTGEIRNAYKIFVEEPEGKRSFGRPRREI
jgi:hypothetical protein